MQGMLEQATAEGFAHLRMGDRAFDATTHRGERADRVPQAGHIEHRRDQAHALARFADGIGEAAVEMDLGGRQLARAELVLEAVDADAVPATLAIARLDEEQAERVTAAGCRIDRACQRERHLADDRRGEPLAAMQAPATVAGRFGAGGGARHVGTAGGLGHPLAGQPERIGIPRGQSRHRARDQGAVAGGLQCRRGTVAHRQRAGEKLAGDVVQVHARELVAAGELAERRLMPGGDQPVARSQRAPALPDRRRADAIDTRTPGIPLHELRIDFTAFARLDPGRRRLRAKGIEIRRDRRQHERRQTGSEPALKDAIITETVARRGHGLHEIHAAIIDPGRQCSRVKANAREASLTPFRRFTSLSWVW